MHQLCAIRSAATTALLAAALLAALGLVPPATAQATPAGGLRGIVRDADYAAPLPGARVVVVELSRSALTTDDGAYAFEGVPPGSYTVVVTKEGYERGTEGGVVVAPGRLTEVGFELSSEVIEMDELVVSGADLLADTELGLLEVRQTALTVQDAISSEIMSKAGASDAADAIRKIVGTTVVDGKYATVRGLSDRYTGTTLNGVKLPTADPRRKAVQMDLFPTGTLESVTVTKTFTPDLQGDFTGGGIDIKTRAVPDGPVLSVGAAIERDSEATENPRFLTYDGGGVSGLSFASDERGLPSEASDPLPSIPGFCNNPGVGSCTQANFDASAAYDRLVRAFSPVMGVEREAPGPNESFSLVAGNRYETGGGRVFGLLGAVTYSDKFDYFEGGQNNSGKVSGSGEAISLEPRSDSKGTEEMLSGGLGNFVFRPNEDHELSLKLIYNHAAEDSARLQVEPTDPTHGELNQALQYIERDVGSLQLHGDHAWGRPDRLGPTVDWSGSWNFTKQDEPDVRFFRYSFDNSTLPPSGTAPPNSTPQQNSRRIFREIDETDYQGSLNMTLPFEQWSATRGSVKWGLYVQDSDRQADQRSFYYQFPTQPGSGSNAAVAANRAKAFFSAEPGVEIWTQVFTDPDRIGLAPNRCAPGTPFVNCSLANQLLWVIVPAGDDVNYVGEQHIDAAYAMSELPLSATFKAIFGVRFERTEIATTPFNEAFGLVEVIEVQESGDRALVDVPQEQAASDIEDDSFLPSIGFAWEMVPKMFLRGAWSRTLARPTFRELAPVATEEFIFGDEYIGNPDLTLSKIQNWDVRWEWFHGAGDLVAASLFFKQLDDPIELISFGISNRSFVQPQNFPEGESSGVEVEARHTLERLWPRLRGFAAGFNMASIDSEVDVPPEEQESLAAFGLDQATRRLQGQPDFLANVNLTFDHEALGISSGVFYNRLGETQLTGAARGVEDGIPDVFEEPYDSLDATWDQELAWPTRRLSLSFKARNLLRDERRTVYRTPEGEEIKTERDTSLRYSVGARYKW